MLTITSISNTFHNISNTSYVDVTLSTVEYGNIPCTLSSLDNTVYNIFSNTSNTFVEITNSQLYTEVMNGQYGNITPFTVNMNNVINIAQENVQSVCDNIVKQVIPSQSKQLAYQNAAIILNSNGNVPPNTGIYATTFNNLASAWGMTPTNFASLVENMQNFSMTLASLELSTQSQIETANTPSILSSIITNFESGINNIVNTINKVAAIPITTPSPILISGVNS